MTNNVVTANDQYSIAGQTNSHPTALIVDDNWDSRLIVHMLLENAGYVVSEATNGGEALLLLDNQCFDLMILDLQMPVMSGEDLLRYLRSYNVYEQMPVIVITAHGDMVTDRIQNLTPYIFQKPLNTAAFLDVTLQFREALIQ